jgi:hypothetical protein
MTRARWITSALPVGWTAPNVRSLTLLDQGGTPLVSVTPEGGFYYLPRQLMPKNAVRLDAFNGGGNVIWSYVLGNFRE